MSAKPHAAVSRGARSWPRTTVFLLVLPVVPALLTATLHPRRPDWAALRSEATTPAAGRLTVADVAAKYPDALWIDARSVEDFASGTIPEALHLTEDDWDAGFAAVMEKWDGERALIVFCAGAECHASDAVARRLRRELGSEDIHVLSGGWPAWLAAQSRKAKR